jgi:uncharacterized protein YbjT (DUF2867 family)
MGRATTARLTRAKLQIRALARHPNRLDAYRGVCETRTVSAVDRASLATAFQGADAVSIMLPPNANSAALRAEQDMMTDAIVTAAVRAGIRRAVVHSSLGAELPSGTGPIVGLHVLERRLRAVPGLNIMFLRSAGFLDNLLWDIKRIRRMGALPGPFDPHLPLPMVAASDVGTIAAEILERPTFLGVHVRELLGSRDYTMTEVAQQVGRAINMPFLPYVQMSYYSWAELLVDSGVSSDVAALHAEMARAINTGRVHSRYGRNDESTTSTSLESYLPALALAYRVTP